jgi:hypothetical protein
MKHLARCAIFCTLAAIFFLSSTEAGRYHGRHGHSHRHYSSRVYVGVGYYGGWGYYPSYWYGGPYWGGAYYAPAPVYRVARYRPASGAVETDIRPKKALVTLNGKPIGEARDFNGPWDVLVLRKGTHTLEFSAPGYMTLRVTLDVATDGYYHLKDRLMEGDGLDPRSTEPPVLVEPEPEPAPAPQAQIVMEDPAPESPAPTPALRRGLLHVRVTPADAAVYLDGEFLAKGEELARLHGSIPVARGEHVLEVIRPGYRQKTLVVLVEGDGPTRVRVELDPEE